MRLVVDTNILFSFFRDNPVRFIIVNSGLLDLELFTATYNLQELRDNKSDLLKYSKLSVEQIESTINELGKYVSSFSSEEYSTFESEAKSISPHDKDIPPFALALKLNCPIWSNEPRFKEQSSVKIWSTKDLRKFFKV